MKLNQIEAEPGNPAVEQYIVEEIEDSDIYPITHNFKNFLKELEDYPFINYLTVNEITVQARKRFVSHTHK